MVGSRIEIRFPYNPETVIQVKSCLPGARFYKTDDPHWRATLGVDVCLEVLKWDALYGYEVDPKIKSWRDVVFGKRSPTKKTEIHVDGLNGTPRPYQYEFIRAIERWGGTALLADEPGLGKTIQSIMWMQYHVMSRPAIIICPASLKENWYREIKNWMYEPKVVILNGRKPYDVSDYNILILNYDIVAAWADVIIEKKPSMLIVDEIHKIKNRKKIRSQAVAKIRKHCSYILGLSGTPMESRTSELFNVLKLIKPELFPNFIEFAKIYCGAEEGEFGWEYSGSTNVEQLNHILMSTVMIRRTKHQVQDYLPDITRVIIPLDIDNRDEYNKQLKLGFGSGIRQMGFAYDDLKRVAVRGKLNQVRDWVSDFLESGEKLVLAAHHIFTLDFLEQAFADVCVRVDGRVRPAHRQGLVDKFASDNKIRLIIGNMEVISLGFNGMTVASNVAIVELGWTPAEHIQLEKRVDRDGQTSSTVTAWYLVARDTVEEEIAEVLNEKQRIVEKVVDGAISSTDTVLLELAHKQGVK